MEFNLLFKSHYKSSSILRMTATLQLNELAQKNSWHGIQLEHTKNSIALLQEN